MLIWVPHDSEPICQLDIYRFLCIVFSFDLPCVERVFEAVPENRRGFSRSQEGCLHYNTFIIVHSLVCRCKL